MPPDDFTEAKQLIVHSLALGRALGDRAGETARAFIALAEISIPQGRFREAENAAREYIRLQRETDQRFGIMLGLKALGEALLWCGEYAETELSFYEMLAIADDMRAFYYQIYAHGCLSSAKAHQGEYGEARAHGELLLNLTRAQEVDWGIAVAMSFLARVALALDENAEARQLLEEGLPHKWEGGLPNQLTWVLPGITTLRQGQPLQARRHFHKALLEATETRDLTQLIEALPAIALFLADEGKRERAVELYALASRYPHVANSRWYEDVCGEHIAAVAATLAPEVVAAAQKRGRARDLWVTAEELAAALSE